MYILIYLNSNISLRDFSHIKPNCRNHIFIILTRLQKDVKKFIITNRLGRHKHEMKYYLEEPFSAQSYRNDIYKCRLPGVLEPH